MRRIHLFEITDQRWCPAILRDAATDYLQHSLRIVNPYEPALGLLASAFARSGARRVVDLCSGAGGPWLILKPEIDLWTKRQIEVHLTDQYPNRAALARLEQMTGSGIRYEPEPIDARAVPERLTGFRTIFTGLHHFRPADAAAIIRDAVRRRQGIGVFEATERHWAAILSLLLLPLLVIVAMPSIRPFRWSRLFLTYIIPVVPLIIGFDAVVSCLRTYTTDELREMAAAASEADDAGYRWQIGAERVPHSPVSMTYLIGWPEET